jgi:hypothetical protein
MYVYTHLFLLHCHNIAFRMRASTNISSPLFLHLLTPIYFRSFIVESNLFLNSVFLLFFFCLVSKEILSFRFYHQIFLTNDQPFLVLLFFVIVRERRLRWAGHVARMGERRGAYRALVVKPERRRPFERPRRRWEDNIKMDLQKFGCWGHRPDRSGSG